MSQNDGERGSISPEAPAPAARQRVWVLIVVGFSVICSLLALREAFSAEFVAPVDGRLHAFWAERYRDAERFKNDFLASYFEAVAPIGVRGLFAIAGALGLHALTFIKLWPLVIGPIATYYVYRLSHEILPRHAAAALAAVLYTEAMWMQQDVTSGAARAFVYALLPPFVFYLVRRRWITTGALLIGLALLYPPIALVAILCVGIELLWHRETATTWIKAGIPVVAALLLIFLASRQSAAFGPPLSAPAATLIPELQTGGRFWWFYDNPWLFWVRGYRSGLVPIVREPTLYLLGWVLPFALFLRRGSPIVRVSRSARILVTLIAASAAIWALAHMLRFRLYQPGRYTMHSWRIVLAVAAAVVVSHLLDFVRHRLGATLHRVGVVVVILFVIGDPIWLLLVHRRFPNTGYDIGREPALYRFLASQQSDVVIASLSDESRNIPTFAKRRVLVASGFGLPWHTRFYSQFHQRTADLIRAQYSVDSGEIKAFLDTYSIGLWVVDRLAFSPDYLDDGRWSREYPTEIETARRNLKTPHPLPIEAVLDSCRVFQTARVVVLSAECLRKM